MVQLSHSYMTTGKTIALIRWAFAGKVLSLVVHIMLPNYWSFSFNISSSSEYSVLISIRLTGLISLQSKGLSRVFSNTTVGKHEFFGAQPSLWSNSHSHAAAAAASLQSCPTLCDPIDGSPPGSAIPGILQARTLEWVAIGHD